MIMAHYYDANPYCVNRCLEGSRARSPGKAKDITEMRLARLGVRAAKSKKELLYANQMLHDYLFNRRFDMYVLNKSNIPFGLDKALVVQCLNQAEVELKQEYEKAVLSDEAIYTIGQAIHANDKQSLGVLLIGINATSSKNPSCYPHLQTEAIKAQTLIALGDYSQAEDVLATTLSVYPYDDFCLYCQAEVLIERPQNWFFGFFCQGKDNDLAQAQGILEALLPPETQDERAGVPMYQSKHDLVWAKYRLLEARCTPDRSDAQTESLNRAMHLAQKVPVSSIYHAQAQALVHEIQAMLDTVNSCCKCKI